MTCYSQITTNGFKLIVSRNATDILPHQLSHDVQQGIPCSHSKKNRKKKKVSHAPSQLQYTTTRYLKYTYAPIKNETTVEGHWTCQAAVKHLSTATKSHSTCVLDVTPFTRPLPAALGSRSPSMDVGCSHCPPRQVQLCRACLLPLDECMCPNSAPACY